MSSFGLLSVKLHSLSPAPCTSAPAPWRPPSSIPHPPPIVRVFFNGVMKRTSTWNPTSLSSVQEGPKSPGEFPILLTLPSSLPPPLGRSLERQLVEGPETGRLVAQLQVIRSSLSRTPSEGRMSAQHSVHPSPAARTNRSGKDWQSRRRRGLGDTAS